MFLNSSLTINNVISNVNLTTQNNELYENGIRVATQTDVDFLQGEIDNIVPGSANALVTDTPLITPSTGAIIFSDGLDPFGTNTDPSFTYQVVDNQNFLTVGAAQVISSNNNMKLESPDYILTTKDFYLQGTEDVQRYLTVGRVGLNNNVKTSVDISTSDYICDNQLASKTQWKGASEYDFDNDVRIGSSTNIRKLFVNDIVVLPGGVTGPTGDTGATGATGATGPTGLGVSAGLLRAINCNLQTPTTVYDVVWSNLTPQQQLEWKGLDPTNSSPTQSLTGNFWNFTKSAPSAAKVGWFIPVDLSSLTFQDLESFWCVVRFNNNTSISTEGSLFFSIYTSPATAPNFYRTRINYQNPGTAINQTGYFYKIHCQDTITTTTTGNFGRAQEVGQQKFKTNPCEVRPDLWHIPFNKVPALAGDTSQGYTNAPILAISIQTASNIHTFDFDVVSIGYLNVQYNLSFAP
jgi:hypothetical protein